MTNKYYFSAEHEKAVIDYCSSTDKREKELLYQNYIAPAFNELILRQRRIGVFELGIDKYRPLKTGNQVEQFERGFTT